MLIPFLRQALCFSLGMIPAMFAGCGGAEAPSGTPSAPVASSPAVPEVAAVTPERETWPTEEEVKAAILKVEYGIHASETNKSVWKVKDFRHEVQSVKLAQKTTQKQMTYGASAITVYPVKVLYTQITDYESKDTTRVEVGADGVWFLYRDSFGEWTGKYGNE